MGASPRRRHWRGTGLTRRVWRSLLEGFSIRGFGGAATLRLARLSYRTRLVSAAASVGGVWILPEASERDRITFLLLIGLVYLPYAVVALFVAKRTDSPLLRVATMAGDMLIVFLFHVLIPQTQVIALLSYLLILAFYSFLGGAVAGTVVAVMAMALTTIAELTARGHYELGHYTLSTYATTLMFMVLLTTYAGREQRHAVNRINRLYETLRTVSTRWELDEVLAVITEAVRTTVGARVVAVSVRESDAVHASMAEDVNPVLAREVAHLVCHAGYRDRRLSPHRPQLLDHVARDPRLSAFAPMTNSLRLGPAILIPLTTGKETMGILVTFSEDQDAVTDDQLDYVAAYAEQASIAVWRWQMEEALRSSNTRLADSEMRQKHALELNDDIVQGLTVAKYALDIDDTKVAGRAVDRTLRAARNIVNDLLRDVDGEGVLAPGDLVRARPAQVDAVDPPRGYTTAAIPPATMEA